MNDETFGIIFFSVILGIMMIVSFLSSYDFPSTEEKAEKEHHRYIATKYRKLPNETSYRSRTAFIETQKKYQSIKLAYVIPYYYNKETPIKLIDYTTQMIVLSRLLKENTREAAIIQICTKLGKPEDVNFYNEFIAYKENGHLLVDAVLQKCPSEGHINNILIRKTNPDKKSSHTGLLNTEGYQTLKMYIDIINSTPGAKKSKVACKIENSIKKREKANQ